MALAPQLAYFKYRERNQDGVAFNFYGPSRATLTLSGQEVAVQQETEFPRKGQAVFTFQMNQPATFPVKVRIPAWTKQAQVQVAGADPQSITQPGWAEIPARQWKSGDRITLTLNLNPRVIVGDYTNKGKAALACGPLVLALDQAHNPNLQPAAALTRAEPLNGSPGIKLLDGPTLAFQAAVRTSPDAAPTPAIFVPFAEAGASGGQYQVWIRAAE